MLSTTKQVHDNIGKIAKTWKNNILVKRQLALVLGVL